MIFSFTASALLATSGIEAARVHTAWVVESAAYSASVRARLSTPWNVIDCSASGGACKLADATNVSTVIGRADLLPLEKLPALRLVQGTSYYYTDGAAVPPRAAIANTAGYWPALGEAQIAEWAIAAIFEAQYQLSRAASDFRACTLLPDTPTECAAASTATNHTLVSELTIGVVGYGRIGTQVAQRAAALGSTVVATKHSGPFVPTPPGLKWLSADNDRLYREADVVVVTTPASVKDIVNATSLSLMKPNALLILVLADQVRLGTPSQGQPGHPTP